jgi:hypothetical protein
MHYLPGALFGPKDHRNPQVAGGNILSSANLCVGSLYPHNGGKLRCHVLRYSLEAIDLAISVVRCATLLGLSNLIPPAQGRTKGVSQGYVFPMGEQLLHRFGVTFLIPFLILSSMPKHNMLFPVLLDGRTTKVHVLERRPGTSRWLLLIFAHLD